MKTNRFYCILFFGILLTLQSCGIPRYTYDIKGKSLDFGQGKWILNETQSNWREKYNKMLYKTTHKEFKKILGDSLFDLTAIRMAQLMPPAIGFKPSPYDLKKLHEYSKCDFLINVTGQVISNGASSFSTNDVYSNFATSNRSSVSIIIYDLKDGSILSSSKADAIDWEDNNQFEDDGELQFTSSAQGMMVQAAKKLIKQYAKHRVN